MSFNFFLKGELQVKYKFNLFQFTFCILLGQIERNEILTLILRQPFNPWHHRPLGRQEPNPGMGPVLSNFTLLLSKQGNMGENPYRNVNMSIPQQCKGVISALRYDLMFPVIVNASSGSWLTFLCRRTNVFLSYCMLLLK